MSSGAERVESAEPGGAALAPSRSGPFSPVEIACDESGSEGEKLVGGPTDVFCHAAVALTVAQAADCARQLREMIRSPAIEYKSGHLLRRKSRAALDWFLAAEGPIAGRADAYLVDKTYLLLSVAARRWVPRAGVPGVHQLGPEATAQLLFREFRSTAVPDLWIAFLTELNDLMRRGHGRRDPTAATLCGLARRLQQATSDAIGPVLDALIGDENRLDALLLPPAERRDRLPWPTLDPQLPAVLRAVQRWGAENWGAENRGAENRGAQNWGAENRGAENRGAENRGAENQGAERQGAERSSAAARPVSVVHDPHVTLTDERIEELIERAGGSGRLAGVRLAHTADDPRVQIADHLAGVARKIASDELAGAGDPQLTARLRHFTDPASIWADPGSASRLFNRPHVLLRSQFAQGNSDELANGEAAPGSAHRGARPVDSPADSPND